MTPSSRPRIVVLTAPSGAGKTTIARRVLEAFPQMRFSVSATTRPPRPHETDGRDYFFLTPEEFARRREEGDFLEFEEVYPGRFYGTLRSEVERAAGSHPVLLDIDVQGALRVKRIFGPDALTVFVRPPSLEALAARLRRRGTETEETLAVRLEHARHEITFADRFDRVIVNEHLDSAVEETIRSVRAFLNAAEGAESTLPSSSLS